MISLQKDLKKLHLNLEVQISLFSFIQDDLLVGYLLNEDCEISYLDLPQIITQLQIYSLEIYNIY